MAFDRRETATLLIGDFLILIASLWAALAIRNLAIPSYSYFESNVLPFLPIFFFSLVIFYIAGLYEKQTRPIRRVMGMRILSAQITTGALAAILFFVLPLTVAPKTILVLYLVISAIGESVWRSYRMKREMKEKNRLSALLLGSGEAVLELFDEVNGNDYYRLRFAHFIDTTSLAKEEITSGVRLALNNGIQIIVVDTSDAHAGNNARAVYGSNKQEVTFLEFASLYEEIFDRVPLDHLGALQVIESIPRRHVLYDVSKRLFDVLLASASVIVAIPFIALAALLLSMTGGTPLILNERIGKGGNTFQIIKLRSMLLNDHGDPALQKKNRVTALGRFLRKTRIDELPQLWNVLTGDLSFIGPRPELPTIAEVYEREIPQYRMRYLIAPGLSGWAQIHDYDAPRGGADVVRTRRKLSYDLYYLKHRSFGLDVAIALKTLRALLSFSGT